MANKCLCAADLDKRITVRRLKSSAVLDASGHLDETREGNWVEVGKRWAQFITRGSREFFRGEEVAADITHQITIRYDKTAAAWTTKMHVKYDGRTFNIAGPLRDIDEQNEWLVFPAVEIK